MQREETLYRMFGRFYPQGTILFSENDPGEDIFYIQSGRVRLTKRAEGHSARETLELKAGDLLGEDVLIGEGRRGIMAETVEDSRLLVIGSDTVGSMVRNAPELSTEILEGLLGRLRAAWGGLRRWQCSQGWERVKKSLEGASGRSSWYVGEVSAESGLEEAVVRMILDELVAKGALETEGGSYRVQNSGVLHSASFESDGRNSAAENAE